MSPAAASSALKAEMTAMQNGDRTHGDTQGNSNSREMKEEPMIIPAQNHRQDKSMDLREGSRHSITFDSEDEDYHESTIDFLRRSKQRRFSADGPRPYLTVSGDDFQGPSDRSSPRVHFHSRVRITAGVRGHRRLSDGLPSAASSISGSPCSSISAPLRSPNAASSKGWGPLGQRVSILASQSYASEPSLPTGRRKTRPKIKPSEPHHSPVNEHTPLLRSPCRYSYARGYNEDDVVDEDVERERERRERVIDETFGKWPGRLLNRHWWWWQLEPLVCCLCVDCTDVED
ncbi:uncharacterized protein EDB91DRAFT_87546 [Suillus paluster]|uniref:uncharacterized protein n=1 Tax=Suillus paluster TaxID=48578 RepID=UPI001B85D493|nr:uncharacterized protein EDB91DRAFT_87546 [Suillus paluster]KAG1725565.1 hypothetical protein EDB91DRAFT_87546 [Suillus paluster]